MSQRGRVVILILAGLMVCRSTCFPQSSTGVILGTVSDSSGAIVPGVKITVLNTATNFQWTTTSNEVGQYQVPFLPIGTYEVTAEQAGFQKQTRSGLTLAVDQKLPIDFSLSPGKTTQTVEIKAQTPLLETATSSTGGVVMGKQIVDFPLNGRNYLQLGLLVPGVVRSGLSFPGLGVNPSDVAFSASGQRAEQNNYILDGVDNKETLFNQPAINPSVDAIGEFKIITGIAPAEYGRGGGAIISTVTKSGTNQLHGNLFEYLRNNSMDARSYFAARTPALRRNEFGGSLGGPVVLPRLYNGKDKTFFFANVDLTRQSSAGAPPQFIVPTEAMRNGVFPGVITDPVTGTPFPSNTIPQNRLNALSLKLQAFYPLPNSAGVQNFIYNNVPATETTAGFYVARVDQRISSGDNLYVRYARSTPTVTTPARTPTGVGSEIAQDYAQGMSVTEVHTFSPRAVNEFRFGWNRRNFSDHSQFALTRDIRSELGVAGVTKDPLTWAFPSLAITGFSSLGDPTVVVQNDDVFQFLEAVTISSGKHYLRAGGDVRWMPHSRQAFLPSIANWSFGGPAFTGNAYADFLLGLPQQTGGLLSPHMRSESVSYFAGYLEDDWKASRNLTLNLGLRYELETPIVVPDHVFSGVDLQTGTLLIPQALQSVAGPFYQNIKTDTPVRFVNVDTPYNADKNNFAPRIGLAYQPSRLKRTVLRAGFGVYYVSPPWQSYSIDELAPFNIRPIFNSDPAAPTLTMQPLQGGGLGNLANAPLTIFPFGSRNILLGYNQQWMFEIQQGLSENWMATINYTGSSGHHMPRLTQGNLAPPGPGPVQKRLRFPWFARIQYLETEGNSSYEAGTASLQRRFAGGSGVNFFYTFSKTIDDAASTNLVVQVSDPQGRRSLEKARSDLDVRHNFVADFTYMLPFGRNRKFLANANPVTTALLGNWQVAGISSIHSTPPTTIFMSPSRVNFAAGGVQAHPNRIGNGNLPGGGTALRWFDTSAFVLPSPFTAGTGGRNIINNPGARDFDLSVLKNFRLREGWNLQVRGEFFNAFNHPNFGSVSNSIEVPSTFGKILGRSGPRIVQLGVRIDF